MRRRIERVLRASEQAILPSHDQFARDRKCYFRAEILLNHSQRKIDARRHSRSGPEFPVPAHTASH